MINTYKSGGDYIMADYRIIADSSCELPLEFRDDDRFRLVPFSLEVDGEPIRDTKDINITSLLEKIALSKDAPKSACPSPDVFQRNMDGDVKRIYIVTISSELSGCYNSARLAKELYDEEFGDKEIFVIDSRSASGGESQLALMAMELEEQGIGFEEIIKRLTEFRDDMKTFFVLDNLDTLAKNGRITRFAAAAAKKLSVKAVLAADRGTIIKVGQAVGARKALSQMVDHVFESVKGAANYTKKRIIITHCNNLERAEEVKKMLQERYGFSNFIVMSTSGLSSLYANQDGIIVTCR